MTPMPRTFQGFSPRNDATGLICAFRFDGAAPRELEWDELPRTETDAEAEALWIHLKFSDTHAHHWVRNAEFIPEDAQELLLSGDIRPSLRVLNGTVFGTLVDLEMEMGGGDQEKGALHFFLDSGHLITVRTRALQCTDRLRRTVREGAGFTDSAELFAALINCLGEGFADKIEALTDEIDEIEASVLSARRPEDRGDLSRIRRQLAELRRYLNPERNALSRLSAMRLPWLSADARDELLRAVDLLAGIGGALEAQYERAKLLQEEVSAQMSEQMNRNLMTLSVLTALLMPATLVSGIFGMNVAGLPGLHEASSFWWVVGLMVLLGLGMLTLLRRLKLF